MRPLDVNEILTPTLLRITGDIAGTGNLKSLLGGNPLVFKGPKRPDKVTINGKETQTNGLKSFTVHVLTNNRDPDSKVHNGTLLINFYCPNLDKGAGPANVELMGPVTERLIYLFDDKPLIITGYNNFNLTVQEPLGPLFDPGYPNEHFMSVRIQFNLFKKGSV